MSCSLIMWSWLMPCSATADLSGCASLICLLCSLIRSWKDHTLYPIYTLPHSHGMPYTPGVLNPNASLTGGKSRMQNFGDLIHLTKMYYVGVVWCTWMLLLLCIALLCFRFSVVFPRNWIGCTQCSHNETHISYPGVAKYLWLHILWGVLLCMTLWLDGDLTHGR